MATTQLRRGERLRATVTPFLEFFTGPYEDLAADPDAANFAVGNPQEFAAPAYVDAVRRNLDPRDKDWFAYKLNEPASQAAVARTLTERTGIGWDPADVSMTNGGVAAPPPSARAPLAPRE